MGSEIENQIMLEEQEKRKFLKYIGTITVRGIFLIFQHMGLPLNRKN